MAVFTRICIILTIIGLLGTMVIVAVHDLGLQAERAGVPVLDIPGRV